MGGGGAKRYVYPPPPNIFIGGGGGDCSPAPPGSTPLGQATWTSKGGYVQWLIQDLQKRGGRKNPCAQRTVCALSAPRAPHTGGVQGPAVGPLAGCRGKALAGGPGGGAPGTPSSFQQIRAFKMVVRSDRKCNFSRCNFAYGALVGGRSGVRESPDFP